MPYVLKGKCVHKKKADGSPGAVVKCHPDVEKAKAHIKALYRNVPDAKGKKKMAEKSLTDEQMSLQLAAMKKALKLDDPNVVIGESGPELFIPPNGSWGNITINTPSVTFSPTQLEAAAPEPDPDNFSPIRLYFREGEKTPDGRVLDPNCVNFNRPPPFSIRLQTIQPEHGGHAGAVVCGVITKIARDGLTIVCDGFLDLTLQAGRDAFQLITNRTMQTWSPDLGDAVVDTETNATDEDSNEATHLEELDHFVSATFLGATLVAMPALASAVVELLDSSGNITVPAPSRGTPTEPAVGEVMDSTGLLKYITDRADNQPAEVSACAAEANPPPEFFTDPQLTELQRYVTITPEGRIFGHAAGRDECHIGFRNQCVTIDMIADCNGNGNFEYAMPGYVVCSDGSKVSTGPIAIKGGHAARGLPWQETLSHYDDPSAAVADVAYGMDSFGPWFSGAIRPTATTDQIRTLLASGVSLDAREIDGELRYLATCAVNTPGFPKVAARLIASSEENPNEVRVVALIAPGGPPEPVLVDEDCGCPEVA